MKILAIASHPDDLEWGCFGTLAKYDEEGNKLFYLVLTDGGDSGNGEARRREQKETAGILNAGVRFAGLPSAFLNNDSGRATIEEIEKEIFEIKPDIIFSHSQNDRHQDHRLVNHATVSACRFFHGELYFYEAFSSLKFFKPNMVVKICDYFPQKLRALSLFTTQEKKFYMKPELVESVAVFRAAQFGFLGKAEAFEVGGIVR